MPFWTACKVKANRERYAQHHIEAQHHLTYCPRFRDIFRQNSIRPMFPSYVFVLIHDRWMHLNSTYGVLNVVMQGHEIPARIPEQVINDLRVREDNTGLVKQVQFNRFKNNDRVEVLHGPFAGQIGRYAGLIKSSHLRVLMDILGRGISVDIPLDWAREAAAA